MRSLDSLQSEESNYFKRVYISANNNPQLRCGSHRQMEPFSLELEHQLTNALENRRRSGKLRRLRVVNPDKYDFSSGDYLGFARDRTLFDTVETELRELREGGRQPTETVIGSGGSRLLAGMM